MHPYARENGVKWVAAFRAASERASGLPQRIFRHPLPDGRGSDRLFGGPVLCRSSRLWGGLLLSVDLHVQQQEQETSVPRVYAGFLTIAQIFDGFAMSFAVCLSELEWQIALVIRAGHQVPQPPRGYRYRASASVFEYEEI